MTIDEIKGVICGFLNGRAGFENCPVIKSPSNMPAPAGNYLAVGLDAVHQDGGRFVPGPGAGSYSFLNVATFYMFEVEGDGDKLRKARNALQTAAFCELADANGFALWEPSNIMKVDTFDGMDYVRQWRMTFTVHFQDDEAVEAGETDVIQSVEGTLNGNEPIYAERLTDENQFVLTTETPDQPQPETFEISINQEE